MEKKKQALVVTTEKKGVFFGYGHAASSKTIRLENARMCVYWSVDVKGVLGLASGGPTKNCRVTPAVPAITLQGVTAVMEATPQSAAAWEAQPWS